MKKYENLLKEGKDLIDTDKEKIEQVLRVLRIEMYGGERLEGEKTDKKLEKKKRKEEKREEGK